MALSDLITRLEQEARTHADEIARDTAAAVRAIELATDAAVAELTKRQIEQGRAARRRSDEQAVAVEAQQARARELEATHAQIARIFARARRIIPEVAGSPAYVAALAEHIDEAVSFLEGLRPRVCCGSALVPAVRPLIEKYEGATLQIDESIGSGVVVEAADRSVVVDNTLTARLSRAETRLAIELARRLGGNGGQ